MKILKTSLLPILLLSSVAPCVCAESAEQVPANQIQVQEKEVGHKSQESEVEAFLLEAYQRHIGKVALSCCPDGSCPAAKGAVLATPEVVAQDIKKAAEFIEKGVDVNSKSMYGASFIALVALLDDVQLVKMLLEKGANPNADVMTSPLMLNVMIGGNSEITKMLIEHGADVNFQIGNQMQTPLMMAVTKQDMQTAKLLIEKGADVNIKAAMSMVDMSFTALFMAVAMKNIEIIELLLEHGAEPNVTCKVRYKEIEELTVLGVAKKEACSQEIIDLLIKYGAKE